MRITLTTVTHRVRAETWRPVGLLRRTFACVIHNRMSAIAETLEIMGNAAAMQAIAEHKAGRTQFGNLDDIPE